MVTGVPEGNYFLFAQLIDGSKESDFLNGGILGGIYENIAKATASFSPEFFNNVSYVIGDKITVPSNVKEVTVMVGKTATSIDFYDGVNGSSSIISYSDGAFPTLSKDENLTPETAPNPSVGILVEEDSNGGCALNTNGHSESARFFLVLIYFVCIFLTITRKNLSNRP